MNSLLNPLNLDQRRAIIVTAKVLSPTLHDFRDALTMSGLHKTEPAVIESMWDLINQIEDLRNGGDPHQYTDQPWTGAGSIRDHLIWNAEADFSRLVLNLKFYVPTL